MQQDLEALKCNENAGILIGIITLLNNVLLFLIL